MTLGFTGTQRGMTQRQRGTVRYLFTELALTELHHGWCVGADADAHRLARELGARIIGHPPSDPRKSAVLPICDFAEIRKPYAYLTRNRHIVRDGRDGLVATPKDFVQPASLVGQGTWTTIGYARKAGRPIWIVFPDGTFEAEGKFIQPVSAIEVTHLG